MIEPTEKDIGRGVIYRAGHLGAEAESGVISSLGSNESTFVRYGAKRHSELTPNVDLEWEFS